MAGRHIVRYPEKQTLHRALNIYHDGAASFPFTLCLHNPIFFCYAFNASVKLSLSRYVLLKRSRARRVVAPAAPRRV